MPSKQDILDDLNKIVLREMRWEEAESILEFNGRPIGCTVRRPEVDRWWFGLKNALAEYLSRPESPLTQKRRKAGTADDRN